MTDISSYKFRVGDKIRHIDRADSTVDGVVASLTPGADEYEIDWSWRGASGEVEPWNRSVIDTLYVKVDDDCVDPLADGTIAMTMTMRSAIALDIIVARCGAGALSVDIVDVAFAMADRFIESDRP